MKINNESLAKIIRFKPQKVLFKKVEEQVFAILFGKSKIWLELEVEDFDLDNMAFDFTDINEINVKGFQEITFTDKMIYFDDVIVLKPKSIKLINNADNKPDTNNMKEFIPHKLVKTSYLLNKNKKMIIGKKYINVFSERLSIHIPIKLNLSYALEPLDKDSLLKFLNLSFLKKEDITFKVQDTGLTFFNQYDIIEIPTRIHKSFHELNLDTLVFKQMSKDGFYFDTEDMIKLEGNSKGLFLRTDYWMYLLTNEINRAPDLYFNSNNFNDANFLISLEDKNKIAVVDNGLVINSEDSYYIKIYEM